jgi:hypothetical protein
MNTLAPLYDPCPHKEFSFPSVPGLVGSGILLRSTESIPGLDRGVS